MTRQAAADEPGKTNRIDKQGSTLGMVLGAGVMAAALDRKLMREAFFDSACGTAQHDG